MNENQEPTNEDLSPDTTDVRDAIERAKETLPEASKQPHQEEAQTAQEAQQEHAQVEQLQPNPVQPGPAQPLQPGPAQADPVQQQYPAQDHANIDTVGMQITGNVEMPSAAPMPEQQLAPPPGQATIPVDHPMAPLYIQQPMPPTLKANRLAGILISLLATAAFALVYAGALAIIRAPHFPPSRFLQDGLLPYLTSLGYVFPVAAFLIVMIIMVLIFNRAGWWVYAVLGVVVAFIVWGAAGAGYSLSPQLLDVDIAAVAEKKFDISRMASFAITLPAFLAAIVAREVTVWFGAWIGARGRKIKQQNASQMQEYEQKLAEVQAQVS